MSKSEKRALRIHHKVRIKNQIKNYFGGYMPDQPDAAKRIGMASSANKPCSGPCCGNPRKHFKEKTLQEKRFEEAADWE